MDIYGDFTESDQAGIPGTMYRFLDLVNVSPEFQYYKRQIWPLLGLLPGEVVLDVGCGVGYESCRLAQEHPQVQIIGWTEKPWWPRPPAAPLGVALIGWLCSGRLPG
jgi:hypothetical protein